MIHKNMDQSWKKIKNHKKSRLMLIAYFKKKEEQINGF